MEIINGKTLSEMCDYSFGDHLGGINSANLPGGFMKEASIRNVEFAKKCRDFEGRVMTLFIDNIRLYPRNVWVDNEDDAKWVQHLMANNNLLGLCMGFPKNKFVIFCSHEDTPIDDQIVLPDNVLGIHAVNAEYNNDRIVPFPYGLQRPIERGDMPDNRLKIIKEEMEVKIEPTKLLYINCGIGRNKDRVSLASFEDLPWVTTRFNKDSMYFTYDKYRDFLDEMRNHKFMICPQGHGMDCHRNWELLYLRRVPVMKESKYFRRLMKGWPVLFVDDWSEVTEELLKASEHLYEEAQKMDLSPLDLNVMFDKIVKSYAN